MLATSFICASCRKKRPIEELASPPRSFDPICTPCKRLPVPSRGRYINAGPTTQRPTVLIWGPVTE